MLSLFSSLKKKKSSLKSNTLERTSLWCIVTANHCSWQPVRLVLESIHCFKEFCLSAVSKYSVSLLRVCGGKARMLPYNSLALTSYCAVQSEIVSADNAVEWSLSDESGHLNLQSTTWVRGSPKGNSDFDRLKCPWMCLHLPQTPKSLLCKHRESPWWEHVLHYLSYRLLI